MWSNWVENWINKLGSKLNEKIGLKSLVKTLGGQKRLDKISWISVQWTVYSTQCTVYSV